MTHKKERKKKRIKVKCVRFVDFGWVVVIVWNCIASAIRWSRIDVKSVGWRRPITMRCSAIFGHSMKFDANTNAAYATNHSIMLMSFRYVIHIWIFVIYITKFFVYPAGTWTKSLDRKTIPLRFLPWIIRLESQFGCSPQEIPSKWMGTRKT